MESFGHLLSFVVTKAFSCMYMNNSRAFIFLCQLKGMLQARNVMTVNRAEVPETKRSEKTLINKDRTYRIFDPPAEPINAIAN